MLSIADLERVRSREPAALDRFFDAYFDRTYGLLFRLSGSRWTAEDLTQDTFLKIHRALDLLDPQRDPWPWVATIATNTCRDHWASSARRLQSRSQSIDDQAASNELRDRTPGPDEVAESQEEAARVQAALLQVPDSARAVVLLHDWQGFTHDEIASMTGRSHASVRQQYSRGLTALGKLLGTIRS